MVAIGSEKTLIAIIEPAVAGGYQVAIVEYFSRSQGRCDSRRCLYMSLRRQSCLLLYTSSGSIPRFFSRGKLLWTIIKQYRWNDDYKDEEREE